MRKEGRKFEAPIWRTNGQENKGGGANVNVAGGGQQCELLLTEGGNE